MEEIIGIKELIEILGFLVGLGAVYLKNQIDLNKKFNVIDMKLREQELTTISHQSEINYLKNKLDDIMDEMDDVKKNTIEIKVMLDFLRKDISDFKDKSK